MPYPSTIQKEIYTKLSTQLRNIRRARIWNIDDTAEIMQISSSHYRRLEQGKGWGNIRLHDLILYMLRLECSLQVEINPLLYNDIINNHTQTKINYIIDIFTKEYTDEMIKNQKHGEFSIP